MRERDSRGQHRCGPGEVGDHAGDAGEGNRQGEEGEGGALRGEGQGEAEDWVSAELIGGEIAFEGDGLCWPWTWRGDGV